MSGSLNNAWSRIAADYARLSSPFRPCDRDLRLFRLAISGAAQRVLLLGVTPALAHLGTSLLAVEAVPAVISAIWIGDGADRQAVLGDWRSLPCAERSRSAIIGDGAITACDSDPIDLMRAWVRVLEPGGVIAIRCFCTPNAAEPLEAILDDKDCGRIADLNVLKWRLAMHIAAQDPDFRVRVSTILSEFNRLFPDRDRLLATTGWSPDQFDFVDQYRDSQGVLRFLPETRLQDCLGPLGSEIQFLRPEGYPLAERCPIIVLRKSETA